MISPDQISIGIAMGAGLASFLSPCVLPLVPTYLTYITGVSATQLAEKNSGRFRVNVMINASAFILGFSLMFIAFGLSASALGKLLLLHQILLRRISGLIIIFFGLNMTGLLKLGLLQREKRMGFTPGKAGPLNSLLLGIVFSAGWTPCIGPILGSILLLAGSSANLTSGAFLLAAYSLGLAIPFLIAALSVGWLMAGMRRYSHLLPSITIIGGILMIVLGIMVFTNFIARLSAIFFYNIF